MLSDPDNKLVYVRTPFIGPLLVRVVPWHRDTSLRPNHHSGNRVTSHTHRAKYFQLPTVGAPKVCAGVTSSSGGSHTGIGCTRGALYSP